MHSLLRLEKRNEKKDRTHKDEREQGFGENHVCIEYRKRIHGVDDTRHKSISPVLQEPVEKYGNDDRGPAVDHILKDQHRLGNLSEKRIDCGNEKRIQRR